LTHQSLQLFISLQPPDLIRALVTSSVLAMESVYFQLYHMRSKPFLRTHTVTHSFTCPFWLGSKHRSDRINIKPHHGLQQEL